MSVFLSPTQDKIREQDKVKLCTFWNVDVGAGVTMDIVFSYTDAHTHIHILNRSLLTLLNSL